MRKPSQVQKDELIQKIESLLDEELCHNPLFIKYPEALKEVYSEYHFFGVCLSMSVHVNRSLILKIVDLVNDYYYTVLCKNVSSSSSDTES